MNIGVLCSGGLGYEALKWIGRNHKVVLVFTDKDSLQIVHYCKERSIPLFQGNPRKGRGFVFLKDYEVDVLASVNYLFLIEEDIFQYPKRVAFNIHGSLLPKYRGRTPHVWAIINNEKETGITAHRIDQGCDTGDVISQIRVEIGESDTGNDILTKFHTEYRNLIDETLKKITSETVVYTHQDDSLATYFGKRGPTDGQINWNWQKERIHNWVRAQAHPYPGAFTYYFDTKITIDKVHITDAGFSYDMLNGLVLSVDPLLVKTPNGVISIDERREDVALTAGEVLK